MSTVCPTCSTEAPPGAAFCDNCGTPLSAAPAAPQQPPAAPVAQSGGETNCPNCNASVMPGEAFCGECGASIDQMPAAQPPSAVPSPAQPAQPAAPAYSPPAASPGNCTSCGVQLQPDSRFCDNCGAAVPDPGQAQPIEQQPGPIDYAPPVPPVGVMISPRLVIQGTNAAIQFPQGKAEVMIGREDQVSGHFPDIDLSPHGGEEGGVSRKHAVVKIQGNQVTIMDLQSVNFTFVNKQKLDPNVPKPLNDGDLLGFGRVVATFHTQ